MATRISQQQLNKFISPEAAMAPYERAQQDKTQRNSQDAALRQLITGKGLDSENKIAELGETDRLNQGAIENNLRRANEQAQAQGLDMKRADIGANESGVSVRAGDSGLASLLGLRDRQQQVQDRAVERFADRQNKLGIPARSADLLGVEAATRSAKGGGMLTNPDYEAKTASRVLGYTPDFLKPAVIGMGEGLGRLTDGKLGFDEGTGTESQAIQSLYNTQIKSESGAAVNMHEQGRQDIALGTKSGNSEQIKRGVERIKRALEMDTQLLEGSAPSGVKEQYRSQGGEYDVNRMLGGSGGNPQPQTKNIGGVTYIRTARGWEEQ